MRALIQRVSSAQVTVDNEVVGSISQGLLVLLGICDDDSQREQQFLAEKISKLRIFSDDDGKMNRSVADIQGEILVVSQFTLYANARKGNRPSYTKAARPEHAIPLYQDFQKTLRGLGFSVASGVFGADMDVALVNDGPVTIWLDTADIMPPSLVK